MKINIDPEIENQSEDSFEDRRFSKRLSSIRHRNKSFTNIDESCRLDTI